MKTIFKFIVYVVLGMAMTTYFLECCADQHSNLEEKYHKECIEHQRGE